MKNKRIDLKKIFTKEYLEYTRKNGLNQSPEMRAFFEKVIKELEKKHEK